MPERPMVRSPHKKQSGWSRGYLPMFGPTHGTNTGGHNGDHPLGKLKKMSRVKANPPGMPQGIHIDADYVKRIGAAACFCGKCFTINNGAEKLVRG